MVIRRVPEGGAGAAGGEVTADGSLPLPVASSSTTSTALQTPEVTANPGLGTAGGTFFTYLSTATGATSYLQAFASSTRAASAGSALGLRYGDATVGRRVRHGIDLERLAVIDATGKPVDASTLPAAKAVLVDRALEAYEHALKNRLLGNLSGRQFATNLLLRDGTWGLATNIENSREASMCGERSAVIAAWNEALRETRLDDLADPTTAEEIRKGLVAEALVMATGQGVCCGVQPCAECQGWLATTRYITPATKLVALEQMDGTPVLRVRSVSDLLPLHTGAHKPTVPSGDLAALEVRMSAAATMAAAARGVSEERLRAALEEARGAHMTNATAEFSNRLHAAATLFDNGEIFSGARFDWTARWFEEADLSAAAQGVQFLRQRDQPCRVSAVAYFGDDWPSVRSLGILAQPMRGGPDTLVVTVEGQNIEVRTIRDFMTELYVSSSAGAGGGTSA